MAATNTRRRLGRVTFLDLRSQFVWVLLTVLGLFVTIVSWLAWIQ